MWKRRVFGRVFLTILVFILKQSNIFMKFSKNATTVWSRAQSRKVLAKLKQKTPVFKKEMGLKMKLDALASIMGQLGENQRANYYGLANECVQHSYPFERFTEVLVLSLTTTNRILEEHKIPTIEPKEFLPIYEEFWRACWKEKYSRRPKNLACRRKI